ncbi:MAG: hypothetical protein EBZ49_15785 [Proteobacteria bacterium]|nr:hypothetical protein [Pseudomonadota bacterium]
MKAQRNWANQPSPDISTNHRPRLRLIVRNTESPPETPTDKAVDTVSDTTELVLAVLAQLLLVYGIFLGPSHLKERHAFAANSLSPGIVYGVKSHGESCSLNSDCSSGVCSGSSGMSINGTFSKRCVSLLSD